MNAILTDSQLRKLAKYVADELEKRGNRMQDEIIGTDEAAKMLGCTKKTLYNRMNEIPHTKVGGFVRFSKKELFNYIYK